MGGDMPQQDVYFQKDHHHFTLTDNTMREEYPEMILTYAVIAQVQKS
jgi:hypothetical protein